uniref:ABC transmembrane type-1 domain-containing protein n=1 Tax=Gongylonema pulchrum TaxID=637853 RepID=A0A183EIZ2_9BILA
LWTGIAISFSMFIVALVQSMILHQYFHKMFMLGVDIRSVLTNAVFMKVYWDDSVFLSGIKQGFSYNALLYNYVYFENELDFPGIFYPFALALSNAARKDRTVGEIVNLMSVDIQRFQDITSYMMLFWSAPFQIILAIYFLWRLLGVAVIAGLTVLFATIPFTSWISIRMKRCQVGLLL